MRNHRDLLVWQRAHALAVETQRATRQFPRRGYTALQSQMVRAAESIVLNVVEGCASPTQKEFARFLDIAIKSASELEAQLELARDYGVLAEHEWKSMSAGGGGDPPHAVRPAREGSRRRYPRYCLTLTPFPTLQAVS